ncbi:hypothetical protein [Bremerella cremea]|uniref:hypothetical protein n=1 Tax=Bremerella cremea TaxID=1031537 RepID=UPI001F1C0E79|nr:hypothetical protein [Bremerella cremea]
MNGCRALADSSFAIGHCDDCHASLISTILPDWQAEMFRGQFVALAPFRPAGHPAEKMERKQPCKQACQIAGQPESCPSIHESFQPKSFEAPSRKRLPKIVSTEGEVDHASQ